MMNNDKLIKYIQREEQSAHLRFGSGVVKGRGGPMDQYRADANARRIARAIAKLDPKQRHDSYAQRTDSDNGLYYSRELEHIYAEELKTPLPNLNALNIFPQDTSPKVGLETHKIRRVIHTGEAAVYRQGGNLPTVGIQREELSFGSEYYATSIPACYFDTLAANFANINEQVDKLFSARTAISELANMSTWGFRKDARTYGILNYPWLRKKVISTPFNSSSTPQAILKALRDFVNFSYQTSKGRYRPTNLVMSTRVYDYINETEVSADNNATILERFLARNSYIQKVHPGVWELENDGSARFADIVPAGMDPMFAWNNSREGVQNVVTQVFTTLPEVDDGPFEKLVPAYMAHGGIVMREMGHNILGYVTPPA